MLHKEGFMWAESIWIDEVFKCVVSENKKKQAEKLRECECLLVE